MTKDQIQEIANTLNDAAHWIRHDPTDILGAVASVEGALGKLRTLDAENIDALHHPEH